MDLDKFKEIWSNDKLTYEKISKVIKTNLEDILSENNIHGDVIYRIKKDESLFKKIRTGNSDYNDIMDKLGLRVIVNLRSDLITLDQAIMTKYKKSIQKKDDKMLTAEVDEFGYQSIHYDIMDDDSSLLYEIQIRTICQDNWSNLSHFLAYKEPIDIPKNIRREINALSALFEVADTQFERISKKIQDLDSNSDIKLLQYLDLESNKFGLGFYNRNMTSHFIDNKLRFYNDYDDIISELSKYVDDNRDYIAKVIKSESDNIFFTQPEILIILERLENKSVLFESVWEEMYPIEDLEEIKLLSKRII